MILGHPFPGRGSAGISTSGPENTKTHISKPDIAGTDKGMPASTSKGIKIRKGQPKRNQVLRTLKSKEVIIWLQV